MLICDDLLDGTCGVAVLWDYGNKWGSPIGDAVSAGCGWYIAGFIDNNECREAYDEMCGKYKLIYQSPVRLNRNSGKDFFFCIFDAGEPDER